MDSLRFLNEHYTKFHVNRLLSGIELLQTHEKRLVSRPSLMNNTPRGDKTQEEKG